ncbi:hypothetical protein GCM10010869_08750 [Mesorhizobium tianshanense]|nr:hypothetical protein GCM10010869_08750 [Mesorhizobium tianshanense]
MDGRCTVVEIPISGWTSARAGGSDSARWATTRTDRCHDGVFSWRALIEAKETELPVKRGPYKSVTDFLSKICYVRNRRV